MIFRLTAVILFLPRYKQPTALRIQVVEVQIKSTKPTSCQVFCRNIIERSTYLVKCDIARENPANFCTLMSIFFERKNCAEILMFFKNKNTHVPIPPFPRRCVPSHSSLPPWGWLRSSAGIGSSPTLHGSHSPQTPPTPGAPACPSLHPPHSPSQWVPECRIFINGWKKPLMWFRLIERSYVSPSAPAGDRSLGHHWSATAGGHRPILQPRRRARLPTAQFKGLCLICSVRIPGLTGTHLLFLQNPSFWHIHGGPSFFGNRDR